VLIISGKCCAEADDFVTPARRVEEFHWTARGKHCWHVCTPRLSAAARGEPGQIGFTPLLSPGSACGDGLVRGSGCLFL